MSDDPVIALQNVVVRYGGRTVFNDVSLELAPGSFHFLTGPSGAGKTTLMNLLYKDLTPHSGAVSVFGSDLAEMDRNAVADLRQRMGVVHQDCQFIDHLSVAENVLLPVTVAEIENCSGARLLLRLALGSQFLLARITRRSVEALHLREGSEVFAVLKAVSVPRSAVGDAGAQK